MKTKLHHAVVALASIILMNTINARAQWLDQLNGFSTFHIIDYVTVVNADEVWATSFQSTAYTHTIDGGSNWIADSIEVPGVTYDIMNLCAVNGDTAWACLYKTAGVATPAALW